MATPERPPRLNAPLVRALMWGARIPTLEALAEQVGVDKANLGRAYRGQSTPSSKMLQGIAALWPDVPLAALLLSAGDPAGRPEALGLRAADLLDPDEAASAATTDVARGAEATELLAAMRTQAEGA